MPLPITSSSSSSGSNRKIMEEIKKNLSGQMVTTNQIAEAFLKMTGSSYSNSQVQDLAVRLEKENGTCRCSANGPCSAPRDKIEQLSCKCLEECYKKRNLSSTEKRDLTQGVFISSKSEGVMGTIKDLKERLMKNQGINNENIS